MLFQLCINYFSDLDYSSLHECQKGIYIDLFHKMSKSPHTSLNKRHLGLIAPPFILSFLATANAPKLKLCKVEVGSKIAHAMRVESFFLESFLVMITNLYEILTTNNIMNIR